MQDFAYKISKIFRGLYPRTPLAGGGDPLPAPSPRSAYGLARGRFAPPAPQTQTSWQVPPPTGSHHKSHPAQMVVFVDDDHCSNDCPDSRFHSIQDYAVDTPWIYSNRSGLLINDAIASRYAEKTIFGIL
jgi:hypothetical protein